MLSRAVALGVVVDSMTSKNFHALSAFAAALVPHDEARLALWMADLRQAPLFEYG